MRYAIAVLLGNTKAFWKAYYIAAGNGGGLKCVISMLILRTDYIAAGNGGGLKQIVRPVSTFLTILPPETAEDENIIVG